MANIKCSACGKRYDYYEHGCCPNCGAYNRPPRRDRVDADGTVHHLTDEEFLSGGAARRRQSGKVCFERDECYEAQPRKVRSSPDLTEEKDSPFNTRVKQTAAAREKKRNPVRIGIIVAIVVLLINVLPLLLTMCSVSDVLDSVEDFFVTDVTPVRPEQYPGSVVQYPVEVGRTFIWWDADARVEEVYMNEEEAFTELELVVWRAEDGAPPEVVYQLPDGTVVTAMPDGISGDEYYTYYYFLTERAIGSECYVLFTGYNNSVYCELTLPLTESAETATATLVTYVSMEETFLWWDKATVVTGADIVESDNSSEVLVSVFVVRAEDYDEPVLCYIDEDGWETAVGCEEYTDLGGGKYQYRFRVDDRMPGSDCWASFDGYNGDELTSIRVLLN